MLKSVLFGFIIAIFAGCGSKTSIPSWYLNPQKDSQFLYATGSASNIQKAEANAIATLRNDLIQNLNSEFDNINHPLLQDNREFINALHDSNEHLCNTLSMRGAKVFKSETIQNTSYVIVKLSKKNLFDYLSVSSNKQLQNSKEKYALAKNKIPIQKYIILKPLVAKYPQQASITQLKSHLISSYNPNNDFLYLKNLLNDFINLKKNISFYLLSDVNARAFVPKIQNALSKEGFLISKTPNNKDSLTIFITSATDETREYAFLKSKNLVKFKIIDSSKKMIAFRQHTFIGNSKKSYDDAKEQAVIYAETKINKLGIFDFIGLQ